MKLTAPFNTAFKCMHKLSTNIFSRTIVRRTHPTINTNDSGLSSLSPNIISTSNVQICLKCMQEALNGILSVANYLPSPYIVKEHSLKSKDMGQQEHKT